jgi:stearoyl-CoA desaturase (delta-9 desaturase)
MMAQNASASARQGFAWWEIDLTHHALRLLAKSGVIRDLRPVPERVMAQVRRQQERMS